MRTLPDEALARAQGTLEGTIQVLLSRLPEEEVRGLVQRALSEAIRTRPRRAAGMDVEKITEAVVSDTQKGRA